MSYSASSPTHWPSNCCWFNGVKTMVASSAGALLDQSPLRIGAATLASLAARDSDIPARLARVELVEIVYASDGLKVRAILARPKDAGAHPCVIYNRGGNRESGAITPEDAAEHLARIADWGYVVIAGQYRGNAGGEGADEFGGADVADVVNLIPLLDGLAGADARRIGMWGWSRGGLMTYQALARTDRISAAIVISGIADAFDYMERRADMELIFGELISGYAQNRDAELAARSPIGWIEQLCKRTPILLLHGGADWRVHPTQALRMAAALYQHKHPFRLVFFEGADHALAEHHAESLRLCRDWLDRYVRDQQPWPSLEPHGT
jgi:dipeptidyl aminopeptidase/acylaminoacyl peptidase